MKRDKTHVEIINSWPTLATFASDMKLAYGTAKAMRRRGKIPAEYWVAVIEKAATRGIEGVDFRVLAIEVSKFKEPAA